MGKKKYIVSIGLGGFPYGTAPIQKLKMMGMAMACNGNSFLVLSNSYVKKTNLNKDLEKEGEINGVSYRTNSPCVFRPDSLIKRIYCRIRGKLNEFFYVLYLIRKNELDAAFIYCRKFYYSALWGLVFKILGKPVYLVYFELRSTVSNRTSWHMRLNDRLYDRFIFYFFTGFITISDLLISQIKKYSPTKPYLIVPPIVDFTEYDLIKRIKPREAYFLFCGSLAYIDVIEFIVKSYNRVNNNKLKLYLILGGDQNGKKKLVDLIKSLGLQDNIVLFNDISDVELRNLYANASALLIPLRNTKQDIARFPHKIAEYCAAGRPIVSTRFGEVARIFDDNSALLADDYDIALYAAKLNYVIEKPDECEVIARNGYLLGKERFNFRSFSEPMYEMIFDKN
jgi:glycosyltransferase involved in cell wall biosynthesis